MRGQFGVGDSWFSSAPFFQGKYLAGKKKKAGKKRASGAARRKHVLEEKLPASQKELRKNQRAKRNKEINQRNLREKIAAGQHHSKIVMTIDELGKLDSEIKKIKVGDFTREHQAKYMTRLGALRTRLDAQFKLLNKYLPDLRSIEFREGEEGNPFATAAAAWASALQLGLDDGSDSN